MAIDCGVYVYEQPSRFNCCVGECFVAKLRWCLIEQDCQGSKVWSALAFQRTGYCAKMYKNLPLRIQACVQDSALVCARAHLSVDTCKEQIRAETTFYFSNPSKSENMFRTLSKISLHLYNALTNVARKICKITIPHFPRNSFAP